jgi:hypothetical protein
VEWLKFRASACAPLFTGEDGLTDTQQSRLNELYSRHASFLSGENPKARLTDNMSKELDKLLEIKERVEKGVVELPTGAKSYIENLVDQYVYKYEDGVDNKYTRKGLAVEDSDDEDINKSAIKLAGSLLFADYKKSNSYLTKGYFCGHPDIEDEDEEMIVDIKSSWNKKTFPKRPEDGKSSDYEWQGKLYCYMKGWRKFRLCYVLMSTPEDLVPDNEHGSLHYVNDLPLNLRVTYIDYELTDKDIEKIERREKAAVKYAQEYYNFLINKNK